MSSAVATDRTEQLFEQIECNSISIEARFECAQNLTMKQLIDQTYTSSVTYTNNFDKLVLDNVVFNATIDNLVENNDFKSCNIITGFESDEFGFFLKDFFTEEEAKNMDKQLFIYLLSILRLPYQPAPSLVDDIITAYFNTNRTNLNLTSSEYLSSIIKIQSDVLFNCQSLQLAEFYTNRGNKAYVYEHDYRLASSIINQIYGVTHTEDIPFVFAEALSNKVTQY